MHRGLMDVGNSISELLDLIVRWVETADVVNWIFIGLGITIVLYAWKRAAAEAELGPIEVSSEDDDEIKQGELAILREELARAGLVPSGGVPAGTPKANLVAAVEKAPVPEAPWLAALIQLIPSFPSPPSFSLAVTSRDGGRNAVTYQVMRSNRSLAIGTEEGRDLPAALVRAANAGYRQIADAEPRIFPPWALWPDERSFAAYRRGTMLEQRQQEAAAFASFKRAVTLAPQNLLARLAVANRYERLDAASAEERIANRVTALELYLGIAQLEPSMYQAHFRAMVLLAFLADCWKYDPENTDDRDNAQLLRAALDHTDDPLESEDADVRGVCRELRQACRREAAVARRLLRPWWTLRKYHRFRHRFELRGLPRRQAGKALKCSRLTLQLRRQGHQDNRVSMALEKRNYWRWFGASDGRIGRLKRRWWRTRLRLSYSVLSGRVGWQADYNAACFYAQLPETIYTAPEPPEPFSRLSQRRAKRARERSEKLKRIAYRHLSLAVRAPDTDLDEEYVRHDDPDLQPLRDQRVEWRRKLDAMMGREAIIHYRRADAAEWMLRLCGDGVRRESALRRPSRIIDQTAEFRVPLSESGAPLMFVIYRGEERDGGERRYRFRPGHSEVWLLAQDDAIYESDPG